LTFEKHSNINFRENPSSGSRVIPCGQRDGQADSPSDEQKGITKLIDTFRNFAPTTTKIILNNYMICCLHHHI